MTIATTLNIDLGELPAEDEALYSIASIANVACGGHAGDEDSIARAVGLCFREGAVLAAHPSYPDRENFGRRTLEISSDELGEALTLQLRALVDASRRQQLPVEGLKLHGALYHDAGRSSALAEVVLQAARACLPDLRFVVAQANGEVERAFVSRGVPSLREGFADRRYDEAGRMVARTEPNAVLEDAEAVAAQTRQLRASGNYDTLCVHGDSAGALTKAREVRRALEEAGGFLSGAALRRALPIRG